MKKEAVFEKHFPDHRADQHLLDLLRVQDTGHGFTDCLDGFAVIVMLSVKNPVHKTLNPFMQGLKEKYGKKSKED